MMEGIPGSPSNGAATSSSDLNSKYTKLASEYAKIRAQFGVVKKALFDERERANDLEVTLKEHEVKARKGETEMEALNFRNGQLTKRIQV